MSVAHRAELRVVPRVEDAHTGDRDLAQALLDGEPWAAAATWNKLAPMVFRFLNRVLGPDGEAEDLTQEVFLRVFSKVRGLRDPDALRSFVFSIAIRTLKSELRRRRVRRAFALSEFDKLPERSTSTIDPEARQALRRFYAILDRLTAEDRAAFVLRHMEGMKLEEVSDALGVSLATVKRRLDRAGQAVSRHVERDAALAGYVVRGRGENEA